MRALTVLLLVALVVAVLSDEGDQHKQLIMLEIERLNYPGEQGVVKRQAQIQYSDAQDHQQVPPEYLTLLHQLSPQDQQPHDIQQVFITRNPQETYTQFSRQPPQTPLPARPPLTPEQEQMRRLQEATANKHIREQQQRALQRALQTGQFQPGFQPQSPYQPQPQPSYQPQPQPSYQPQPQPSYQSQPPPSYESQPQPSYQPQPPSSYHAQPQPSYRPQSQQYQPQPEPQVQYESSSSFGPGPEPQYSQPQSPEYYQQTRSIRPTQLPKTFSYSQVQFGTSETLEPLVQQKLQSQVKPEPEYYVADSQLPSQAEGYRVQSQQQTPTQPQHPQQYLIETTRPSEQSEEPVVRIPRPHRLPASQSLYYRPEPATPVGPETLYTKAPEQYTVPSSYQTPRPYSSEPQNIPRPEADSPSRSAYFVQQSGISKRVSPQQTPTYNSYSSGVPRIPTPHGQRALTASEIKALSKAGFQVSHLSLNSLQEPSEISPAYDNDGDDEAYRSPNSKRQSQYVDETKPPGKYPKRIPKPVPLTETERRMLAEQGIRNLYRVESAESKDSPVTYVLAIDSAVMMSQSESSRDTN